MSKYKEKLMNNIQELIDEHNITFRLTRHFKKPTINPDLIKEHSRYTSLQMEKRVNEFFENKDK